MEYKSMGGLGRSLLIPNPKSSLFKTPHDLHAAVFDGALQRGPPGPRAGKIGTGFSDEDLKAFHAAHQVLRLLQSPLKTRLLLVPRKVRLETSRLRRRLWQVLPGLASLCQKCQRPGAREGHLPGLSWRTLRARLRRDWT